MKEAGVGIESREMYDGGDAVAKILPQLLSRKPRFDFVQYPALFFGAFAETGQLEPLDDYLAQYEGSQEYLDWVMPAYREFYTKWSGKTYGMMLDGDIHILHYRKSYFENAELQKQILQALPARPRGAQDLGGLPQTTQFFTEELKSQGIYGTSMVVNPPNFGWGFWMDIAASAGVNYFDENMNPTINQGKAAEALDIYREIIKFGPPGAEAMDIGTTIQRWQSGSDVMSRLVDRPRRVHGPAAGRREGRGPARRHRAGLEERRRLDHQPGHLALVPDRLDPQEPAPGRQGCGLLLHLPHVAPGLLQQDRGRRVSAAPIPSARATTATPRPSSTWRPTRSAARQRPLADQRRHLQELRHRQEPPGRRPGQRRGRLSAVLLGGRAGVRRRPGPQHLQGDLGRADLAAGAGRGGRGVGQDRPEAGHRQARRRSTRTSSMAPAPSATRSDAYGAAREFSRRRIF